MCSKICPLPEKQMDFHIFYDRSARELEFFAAAAAKSLQSCPTLCSPIDGSPPGSPVPGILQARTPQWVAISFSNAWKWKVKVKSLSRVRLLATPWTAAHQAPPSMGFSRQEYWSWGAIAFSNNSEHWFSKCGPQIIRISITWKHKFQSCTLPQTFWIRKLQK